MYSIQFYFRFCFNNTNVIYSCDGKANFSVFSVAQSFRFGAQESFLNIIINVENGFLSVQVETLIVFQHSLRHRKFKKQNVFEIEIWNITNVFTVTFDQLNVSLLKKITHFFKKPKPLNSTVQRSLQMYL